MRVILVDDFYKKSKKLRSLFRPLNFLLDVRERALGASGACLVPTEVERRSNPFESELDSNKKRDRGVSLSLFLRRAREDSNYSQT